MKISKLVKIGAVPAILAVGLIGMQALGSTTKQSNKRENKPEARGVETQRLVFGEHVLAVEGNGLIESERMLNIVSEASGKVRFATNNLKDGTFVREGEVVVRIDSRDVENDLFALRSDFMNAVASVLPELQIDDAKIYRRWFDYFNALDISSAVPELPEVTNAQEKIKISTKNIIGKYYGVRNQEILLSKYTVHAPFDGYISSNGVIEDSYVTLGQQLFTLNDAENLVISVPLLVEESEAIDFSSAPRVTISSEEGGQTKAGRVTRRETVVDRNSQTLNVFVTFRNRDLDPHFLPGNYVHVSIEGKVLRDVAPIPRHLLGNGNYVYTMVDGVLGSQPVDVVAMQEDYAIVRNSVPEETVIVTTILQRPLVGMAVRSINMPELNRAGDLADSESEAEPVADGKAAESVSAGG